MKGNEKEQNEKPTEKNRVNFNDEKLNNSVETEEKHLALGEMIDNTLYVAGAKRGPFSDASYFDVYKYATEVEKYVIYLSILLAIGMGLLAPYSVSTLADVYKTMMDYEIDVRKKQNNSYLFLEQVQSFAILYSSVGVTLLIGAYLSTTLMTIAATNQISRMRLAVLKSVLYQDFEYYDRKVTTDFAFDINSDIDIVEDGIGYKVVLGVTNITAGVGCMWMAISQGWKLALTLLAYMPVDFLLLGITASLYDRFFKKLGKAKEELKVYVQEVLTKIRTVLMFNGQQKEIGIYRNFREFIAQLTFKKECVGALTLGLITCNTYFIYAMMFCVTVHLIAVDSANYDARVMISVFFGILYSTLCLTLGFQIMPSMLQVRNAGARIFKLFESSPSINRLHDSGLRPDVMDGNIELKDVIFRYPHTTEGNELQEVNLTVKRGQSVALVGSHPKSGQIAVVLLLARFYDCNVGHVSLRVPHKVYIDGHDVRDLSVRWLRAHIGLVGQEPVLFNTTVRENIRYGRGDATDAEIEEAAKKINAHEFIIKLPLGYNTVIGGSGVNLTNGQKRCIAIARALIRDPVIMLVHESSAPISLGSEIKAQQALEAVTHGRTTLTVARKVSTTKKADVIFVFKEGMIVESGNHEELMKRGGLYYDMVTTNELIEPEKEAEEIPLEAAESSIDIHRSNEQDDELTVKHTGPMKLLRALHLNFMDWILLGATNLLSFIVGLGFPILIFNFGVLFGQMSHPSLPYLMEQARFVAITCAVLGVVMGVTNFIKTNCYYYLMVRLDMRVKVRMFKFIMQQPIEFFEAYTWQYLSNHLASCSCFLDAVGAFMSKRFQGAGSIGLAVLFSIILDWRVTLVALIFMPLISLAVHYQTTVGDVSSVHQEQSEKLSLEAVTHARTLSFLGQESKMLKAYETELIPVIKAKMRLMHFRGFIEGLSFSVLHFVNASALAYGGFLIVKEGVQYQNLFIITRVLELVFYPIPLLFVYNNQIRNDLMEGARTLAELEQKPVLQDPQVPAVKPYTATGEIEFNNVGFKYPKKPNMILTNLNLKIERGKTTAILGDKGCGKSTLFNLMLRFYDPTKGLITMDGIPLVHLLMNDIRKNIGVVPQEPVLFDRTIGENIAYGDTSRTPTHMEVEAAAKAANIHNFIVTLPLGYNTKLGGTGLRLSFCEKQKVAIARAMLRHPRILLVDDPTGTADLDEKSEKEVREAIARAAVGRTCVFTTREASATRASDVVCLLRSGRVLELGAHDDLLARRGFYYQLYNKE